MYQNIYIFWSNLIGAWRVALLADTISIIDMCVTSDVAENPVHAGQTGAGAYLWVIIKSHRVEEWDAFTISQDFIVCRGKKAVGEAISKFKVAVILEVLSIN